MKMKRKKIALKYKQELIKNKIWENTIVTEILNIDTFYPAENYHHNYYKTIKIKDIVSMLFNQN